MTERDVSDSLVDGALELVGYPRVGFVGKLHLVRNGRALCGRPVAEEDTYATMCGGWGSWRGCPGERCSSCQRAFDRERVG